MREQILNEFVVEGGERLEMEKKRCGAVVPLWIIPILAIAFLTIISLTASAVPHPIFGTAVYAYGGGNADGATVEVVTNNTDVPPEDRVLTTIVGPEGGWGSGEWQVDCGDPGPNWPEGSYFVVYINGTDEHEGWRGIAEGVVSGYYNDMGEVVLYPPLEADADGPYEGTAGIPIQFNGNATGGCPPYTWFWDFGDGYTSTEQNPVHTYASSGNYTVTLTVTDSRGVTANDTTYAQVYPPLEADANGPYKGIVYNPIQFVGNATGGSPPYTWFWDFGDGCNSTEQNPTHTYASPGNYTVTLTVTDSRGVTANDTTYAQVYPPLEADADGPYEGTAGIPIQFNGNATGGCPPYTWFWDFGDGSTSTEQTPVHTYESPGNYTVTLTVTDSCGTTANDTTYAYVHTPELKADADGPYTGVVGTPIQFRGSATGGSPPYTWFWDFGDGHTSTEQNPVHTYANPGTYTVTLTVTDSLGVTANDTTYAYVHTPGLQADADGPYTGVVNSPVQFVGSATGGSPPYTWFWDFGDGSTSTEQNPVHTYTSPGNYTVTLTVTDSEGNNATDVTTAIIVESDTTPPVLEITKPLKNSIYIKNHRVFPFIGTWIFGEIDIEVNASDEHGIDKVEFYINGVLKATDSTPPYTWKWSERTFGRYTIKIIAYDNFGNSAVKEIKVWKFF